MTTPLCFGEAKEDSNDIVRWLSFPEATYEIEVAVVREEQGNSAHATRLPGIVGEGDTIAEAIESIVDAFHGVVREYRDCGSIPWIENPVEGEIAKKVRVIVNG